VKNKEISGPGLGGRQFLLFYFTFILIFLIITASDNVYCTLEIHFIRNGLHNFKILCSLYEVLYCFRIGGSNYL